MYEEIIRVPPLGAIPPEAEEILKIKQNGGFSLFFAFKQGSLNSQNYLHAPQLP